LSGRWWALVVSLAVVSAAVGAGAALLIKQNDDAATTAAQVAVVANVTELAQDEQTIERGESQQSTPVEAESTRQVAPAAEPSQESSAPETATDQPSVSQSSASDDSPPDQSGQSDDQPYESQQVEAQQDLQEAQARPEEPPDSSADMPSAASASISPGTIAQGESFAVTVKAEDATAVAATLLRRSWSLSEVAPGVWWVIVPVPRDSEIGATELVIDLYGEGGVWLDAITSQLVVLANTAPFEEITLGGTGTSLDPAEVARDIAVRFEQHTAVTGPPRWSGPWILPVEGEVTGVFGSQRSYDGVLSDQWHHGHDIAAQHGDPILAPAPGTVVWTGDLVLHGMGVIIDHGAGVYSGYWHMSLIAVREGVEVEPGDYLGNIGTTGLSTGPHLHWEVIIQGIDVDPVQWTTEDQPPLPPVLEATADTLE